MNKWIKICLEAILLCSPMLIGYALNILVFQQGYSESIIYNYQQQAIVSRNIISPIMFAAIAAEMPLVLGWIALTFTTENIETPIKRKK